VERKRFYEVSRSSDVEVDNCLEVMLISNYFTKEEIATIENLVEQIFKLLSAMIDNTK
jgi:four helix bundle protein